MNAEIPSLISSMVCLCFSAACQRVTPLSKNANEISNIQNASKMYVTIHVFFAFVYFLPRLYESVPQWLILFLWGWKPVKTSMDYSP